MMINAHSQDFSLRQLEQSLKTDLRPVQPDRRFVGQLRDRLVESPVYRRQHQLALKLLTIAIGLIIGLLTFLLGKRILEKNSG